MRILLFLLFFMPPHLPPQKRKISDIGNALPSIRIELTYSTGATNAPTPPTCCADCYRLFLLP